MVTMSYSCPFVLADVLEPAAPLLLHLINATLSLLITVILSCSPPVHLAKALEPAAPLLLHLICATRCLLLSLVSCHALLMLTWLHFGSRCTSTVSSYQCFTLSLIVVIMSCSHPVGLDGALGSVAPLLLHLITASRFLILSLLSFHALVLLT